MANAIDPTSTPKEERSVYTRKVDFKDTTPGAEKSRATFFKNLSIATQVYLLNKVGKNGNSLVAKYYSKSNSRISHICRMPEIKHYLADAFGKISATKAAEILGDDLELLEIGFEKFLKRHKRKPVQVADRLAWLEIWVYD